MQVPDVFSTTFLDNPARAWFVAVVVTLAVYAALGLTVRVVRGRLAAHHARTRNHVDDLVAAALARSHRVVFLVTGAWVGSGFLDLPSRVHGGLASLAEITLMVQAGLWLSGAIVAWVGLQREERLEDNAAAVMSTKVLSVAVRLALWSVVLLLALSNLGVDVTALVTGLGIGGVAVALAAQAVLGDLLASISIVTDKPFVLGDFLIIGDFLGVVEDIGLRTTRVRSLSGEQLIFSNNDLIKSRIRNYGRMYERRVVFSIGVTYQTPREKLEAIPDMIRTAVERHEKTRFDRSHFQKFGDSALTFESVYYVLDPDYNLYMDIQQAINLELVRRFEEEDIDFAYPTRTLFVEHGGGSDGSEPLAAVSASGPPAR